MTASAATARAASIAVAAAAFRDPAARRRRRRAATRAPAASNDDDVASTSAASDEELIRRLHVAFLAVRRGSRFAAQEFALVATDAYEHGLSVASLRMDVALLGLSTSNAMGMSEQDAFLSHYGMCAMTLFELSWPSPRGGVDWCPVENLEEDREANGLLKYIRATFAQSDAGFNLKRMEMERLLAIQAREAGDDDAVDDVPAAEKGIGGRGRERGAAGAATREPPSVLLMRTNVRLTLLLREMVLLSRGLNPVSRVISAADYEADAEAAERKNVKNAYAKDAWAAEDGDDDAKKRIEDAGYDGDDGDEDDDDAQSPQVALEWCVAPRTPARTLAAGLLTSYVSVLTTHPVGLRAFAARAIEAYKSGIPAREITAALRPAEFDVEVSRRGMFGDSADATKFFAFYVTTAYAVAQERGLLPGFDASEIDSDATRAAITAASDPDAFAWAPAPGEEASDAAAAAGKKTVAGMRPSVAAWIDMDQKELDAKVRTQLSVDEDEDVDVGATVDDADAVMGKDGVFGGGEGGDGGGGGGGGGGARPPGFENFTRDDFLSGNSITIAALTIQRMIVSFTLQEIERAEA